SSICGRAKAVLRYSAWAPSLEAATVVSMNPRWLRQRIAMPSPSAMPASVAEHEEVALALLEVDGAPASRPHDDPDPARRVARRIPQRLDGMGKWGGYHTEFQHLARGFAPADRALASATGRRC
ncbi:MAG: hypothetical protein M3P44_09990, partial [Actinomycetota bacterium]|nr:hypothetical protein [Actinomycetota bacterium]